GAAERVESSRWLPPTAPARRRSTPQRRRGAGPHSRRPPPNWGSPATRCAGAWRRGCSAPSGAARCVGRGSSSGSPSVASPIGGTPERAGPPTPPGPEGGGGPRGGTGAAQSGAAAARDAAGVTHDGAAGRDGASRGAALAVTRAEEMARYTAVLLEPLHAQL